MLFKILRSFMCATILCSSFNVIFLAKSQTSGRQFFQPPFSNPFDQFIRQQSNGFSVKVDNLPQFTFEQRFREPEPSQSQQFLENRLDTRPFIEQTSQQLQVAPNPQFVQEPAVSAPVAAADPQLASPCATRNGEAGRCTPLIKCISFYAELAELQSQPCNLNANERGVCCPLRNQPPRGDGGRSGILKSPPPPDVPIPVLTSQQLNQAAMIAIKRIKERLSLQENLVLNRIFPNPDTPAARHQEFFPTTNATLQTGEKAQKSIEASVGLVNDFNLTPEQGTFALPKFSILNTVLADTCPKVTTCIPFKYRTPDGSCNNLENMAWGKAGTAYQRILPPKYEDGVNVARFRSVTGSSLPSARAVSTGFAQDFDVPSENYTLLVMQWGQFLDHDLTHTPISRGQGGAGISCCRNGQILEAENLHPDCFPINLPRNDHVFGRFGDTCMEFVRSLPAPRPECNFGPREQLNQITGYLDGSNVYGSSQDSQDFLRLFKGGWLRAQNVRGKMYLPANSAECSEAETRASCFSAGDGRVNEQIELAVMHMLWLREHNRIATALAQLNPEWSDEALFQETRRIVIAEIQHITYNEFLPIILGRAYAEKFELVPKESGYTRFYDRDLNAGITNVFASAAYRFGHSLIQGNFHGYGKFGNIRENMVMSKQHFKPFTLYKQTAFDDFMRGLSLQPSQKADRFFSREITDRLFQGDGATGFDLFAFNIQRGRDHGLPGYNEWRQVCGLPKATNWNDLEQYMDSQSIARLARLYESVDDVDLYTAGLAEFPLPDAMLGPTLVCLLGDQFSRLKRGDRFFYEEEGQPSAFNDDQLREIRKASLSRIICDNADNIQLMQPLAFIKPSVVNQKVACEGEGIPKVNLDAWFRERPAVN